MPLNYWLLRVIIHRSWDFGTWSSWDNLGYTYEIPRETLIVLVLCLNSCQYKELLFLCFFLCFLITFPFLVHITCVLLSYHSCHFSHFLYFPRLSSSSRISCVRCALCVFLSSFQFSLFSFTFLMFLVFASFSEISWLLLEFLLHFSYFQGSFPSCFFYPHHFLCF